MTRTWRELQRAAGGRSGHRKPPASGAIFKTTVDNCGDIVLTAAYLSDSDGNFPLGHIEVAGFKLVFIQSPPHKSEHGFVAKFTIFGDRLATRLVRVDHRDEIEARRDKRVGSAL